MKKIVLSLLGACYAFVLFGQIPVGNLWQEIPEQNIQSVVGDRWIVPQKYRTFQLDRLNFSTLISQANSTDGSNTGNSTSVPQTITVPLPDGTTQSFTVKESSIMEPALAKKFPEIKTYSGQGIEDPTAKIYVDLTPKGFHGMILSKNGTIFIDPYYKDNDTYYMAYYKKNFKPTESVEFSCEVRIDKDKLATEEQDIRDQQVQLSSGARMATIQMRTYRIAIGATNQFTAFHGGTVAGGLAAINTTLNRVRGVYEDEVAVSFILVANNDQVVFTTAANDPYTNGDDAIDENQAVLDGRIGSANYDVGHVFTTSSGVAGLGVVCGGRKAEGTTGLQQPTGDPFNIDYVAHEIGHQFGGNHTFNGDSNACTGRNRNGSTAYEPGSGTTIQAYAGICGNDNTQNNSDAYFHLISLNEIRAHVTTESGANCGTLGATNTTPIANANVENISGKSIPANTPFELTGSATDPDGDDLIYNWEQWDLGPQSDLNNPGANAPLFRSFEPTSNPTRTFPKLSAILSNSSSLGEQLPTGARNLNFQFIARDDNAVGGYDAGLISLGVVASTGFKMNSPNTGGTFSGSTAVTWDVAGTTASPISCGQVDIYLSTDGGQTFGQLLVDNTPNDGSANVILPEINVTTARLKVKCADNVFFDINDANFTIQPSGNSNCAITNITAGSTSTCNGSDNTYTQQVTVTFNDAPATGNLVVNGQSFTLSGSPQTVTLTGLNSDGNAVDVTASFSDNFSCSLTRERLFTAPVACVAEICTTYNSGDTPIAISGSGTPTISSALTVNQEGAITSVKVKNLVGDHSYIRDLTIDLTSPAGTTVTLFSNICNSQNNFNVNFDDAGSANSSLPCPPVDGGTYQPSSGTFASFNDQNASGTWTLSIRDNADVDGGSLNGWSLEICTFNELPAGDDCNAEANSNISNTIAANTYHSSETIISTGTVAADTKVIFKAGTSITLSNGFHAVAESDFTAQIAACQTAQLQAAEASQRTVPVKPTLGVSREIDPTVINVSVYPNPFVNQTTIAYDLGKATEVTIRLLDLRGREIQRVLPTTTKAAGQHQLQIDANQLTAGMYLLHLQTKDAVLTKRLVVQR